MPRDESSAAADAQQIIIFEFALADGARQLIALRPFEFDGRVRQFASVTSLSGAGGNSVMRCFSGLFLRLLAVIFVVMAVSA